MPCSVSRLCCKHGAISSHRLSVTLVDCDHTVQQKVEIGTCQNRSMSWASWLYARQKPTRIVLSHYPEFSCLVWENVHTSFALRRHAAARMSRYPSICRASCYRRCWQFPVCSELRKLEMLYELNVATNQLSCLPASLTQLPKLVVLRAHSNFLRNLPDFRSAKSLRVRPTRSLQRLNFTSRSSCSVILGRIACTS